MAAEPRPSILVAGVGNIFLGDDAFGVEVVQRMARRKQLAGVCIKDFGIRSYDLAYALMEPWQLVILVDAMPRGGAPGTLYMLEPRPLKAEDTAQDYFLDAHSLSPSSILSLVRQFGGQHCRLVVVGCEPESTADDEGGCIGLSDAVHEALDHAVAAIEELIAGNRHIAAA